MSGEFFLFSAVSFVMDILNELVKFQEIPDVILVPVSISVELPPGASSENRGAARVDFEQPFSFKVKL